MGHKLTKRARADIDRVRYCGSRLLQSAEMAAQHTCPSNAETFLDDAKVLRDALNQILSDRRRFLKREK